MSKISYSLKSTKKIIHERKPSQVFLITSKQLEKKLDWAIEEIGVPKSHIIILPDGEKAKEWKELEKLLQKFSSLHLDRKSIVIALGGGTIGDTVGFAASVYLRGIPYIQVPTTLLAQVDSAHGGKTGINFSGFKNQIGTFYPPIATIIDIRFLKSLSKEQIVDGLGETIKAGFIKDASILALLQKETIETIVKSPNMRKILEKAIKVKEFYVEKDFGDANVRQILNVGHTFGHSIELKYGISHGRAVIIGLLKELKFTESIRLSQPSVRKKMNDLLETLCIEIDTNMKPDWKMILHDKKVVGKKIVFPVIKTIGEAKLIEMDLKIVKEVLKK